MRVCSMSMIVCGIMSRSLKFDGYPFPPNPKRTEIDIDDAT